MRSGHSSTHFSPNISEQLKALEELLRQKYKISEIDRLKITSNKGLVQIHIWHLGMAEESHWKSVNSYIQEDFANLKIQGLINKSEKHMSQGNDNRIKFPVTELSKVINTLSCLENHDIDQYRQFLK